MMSHLDSPGHIISSLEDERLRLDELNALNIIDTEDEEAFDRITKAVARLFNAPISYISFVTQDRQWMKSCIGLEIRSTSREVAFCQYVVALKETVISRDTLEDPRFMHNPLVKEFGFRFYVGAPLTTKNNNIIGTLCIMDFKARPFTQEDQKLLEEISQWVVTEIELRDLVQQQQKEKLEVERELEWAGALQKELLPDTLTAPELNIHQFYRPSKKVSGDLFNYHWVSKDVLLGYLVDVMGHGIPTSLQTSAIRVLFSEAIEKDNSLSGQISWVNQKCQAFLPADYFFTAFSFQFDFRKRTLTYVAAGINRFHSWTPNVGAQLHRTPGSMLGIQEQAMFETHTLPIESGQQFLFYTDGFTDIVIKEKLWEEADFQASPKTLAQTLKQKLSSKTPMDDITALFIQIN